MHRTLGNRLASILTMSVALAAFAFASASSAADVHKTGMFSGKKANTGYATHSVEGGKNVLTLSDDFIVPDAPAPHWQVVDSKGNTYLLNRLLIKDANVPMDRQMDKDKQHYNRKLVLPAYVTDVAKVQIWCAWAEVLLGEASFTAPVSVATR